MSTIYPTTPPTGGDSASNSTADTAKEQASNVAQDTKSAAGDVLGTTKDEAAKVASEAKVQVKDLIGQGRTQLADTATTQQQNIATGLRSLSDELDSMAGSHTGGGVASDLISQASSRVSGVAGWLENGDPSSLLEDVKNFARRRPVLFIAIAAGTGLLAGRLTRSLVAEAKDEKEAEAAATAPSAGLYDTNATYGTTGTYGTAGAYGTTDPDYLATEPVADPLYPTSTTDSGLYTGPASSEGRL